MTSHVLHSQEKLPFIKVEETWLPLPPIKDFILARGGGVLNKYISFSWKEITYVNLDIRKEGKKKKKSSTKIRKAVKTGQKFT